MSQPPIPTTTPFTLLDEVPAPMPEERPAPPPNVIRPVVTRSSTLFIDLVSEEEVKLPAPRGPPIVINLVDEEDVEPHSEPVENPSKRTREQVLEDALAQVRADWRTQRERDARKVEDLTARVQQLEEDYDEEVRANEENVHHLEMRLREAMEEVAHLQLALDCDAGCNLQLNKAAREVLQQQAERFQSWPPTDAKKHRDASFVQSKKKSKNE